MTLQIFQYYTGKIRIMQEVIDKYFEIIAKNIRLYRKQAKLSQEKLAESVDCSREFVNRLENTKEKISLNLLLKFSVALKIKPEEFFKK